MPSLAALRDFIGGATGRIGKREIARAFSIAPEDRAALRELLKQLEREGALEAAGGKRFRETGRLPETAMVEITGTDRHGEALARPIADAGGKPAVRRPPIIFMMPERRGQPALAPGARVLARLRHIGEDRYEGRTLKLLDALPASLIGVFRAAPAGGWIEPVDRKTRADWQVPEGETGGAEEDELVRAEPLPGPGYGPKLARVVERLGRMGDARSISLIAIASLGIPVEFPEPALEEAGRARGVRLGRRTDLREVPLVTIDGADARDF
ncbi:MAG TPA: ribonuclease R, partial [Acetobacteraceae bacterium]|nr:ribonuclease R [Acetobacteraceae bacterium]